jgi:hypothetical protein
VTTRLGGATVHADPFFLKRLLINSLDDIPLFKAKLEGGYDWMRYLQRGAQFAKVTPHFHRWMYK